MDLFHCRIMYIFISFYLLLVWWSSGTKAQQYSLCQPITMDMCRELPYNLTSFPNLVGNEDQTEAELQLNTFAPLIQVECSSLLKFFLCSVYVPMCTDKVPIPIGPCRPLCESVRSRCEPMLSQFGFPWPPNLNCSKFPRENNNLAMCMKGPAESDQGTTPPKEHTTLAGQSIPISTTTCKTNTRTGNSDYIYVNRTGACARKCHSVGLFSANEKRTASSLSFALATVSVVLIFFCIILLCCKGRQMSLKYPEAALLFLALCFVVASITHLVTFMRRTDISCTQYAGTEVLVMTGLQHIPCTVVGIVLYYFGSAARVWWLNLCWAWFLSSGLGWSSEALYMHRFPFHAIGWGLPLLLVFVVLLMQAIDADELTGICYVGQQHDLNLLWFLAIREVVFLVLGFVPLLLGLTNLRDRRSLKNGQSSGQNNYLTGLVCSCYLPIGSTLVACYFYEYSNRTLWSESASIKPSFETLLVKIAADLLYGLLVSASAIAWLLFAALRANKTPNMKSYPVPSLPPSTPAEMSANLYPERHPVWTEHTKCMRKFEKI